LTSFWLPVPVVAGLPDVAGRAGLPGGAAGRVTRLEALRTFSEYFPNIFRTLSNIVGGTPRPREGQGRGHPPVPNISRTFPEHVSVGSFIALAQRARAPTSSEHFPNIFRTLSGDSLARERAREECPDTPTGDPPSAETESTASIPEHTSASFNIGGLAGGLVDGPAGPARRFAALAGWLAGWPARYPSSFWLPNVSREVVKESESSAPQNRFDLGQLVSPLAPQVMASQAAGTASPACPTASNDRTGQRT